MDAGYKETWKTQLTLYKTAPEWFTELLDKLGLSGVELESEETTDNEWADSVPNLRVGTLVLRPTEDIPVKTICETRHFPGFVLEREVYDPGSRDEPPSEDYRELWNGRSAYTGLRMLASTAVADMVEEALMHRIYTQEGGACD